VPAVERGWQILAASTSGARLRRETAESVVAVDLALGGSGTRCDIDVAPSIHVAGMGELLAQFADGAGIGLDVSFEATRLSSSHVVTEDIGLALGRALKCVAVERITAFGINGAGSNVDSVRDIGENPVRVGISMEGRKFWKYVPFDTDYAAFRRSFLIGHTLPSGIFTEDLDDFVDGLSGGLQASVIVHVDHHVDPVVGWPLVFRGLGTAMAELLRVNTDRKGLTAGVKATLA
jgi:imidazoleglycerol phosphate dehydratase HisB